MSYIDQNAHTENLGRDHVMITAQLGTLVPHLSIASSKFRILSKQRGHRPKICAASKQACHPQEGDLDSFNWRDQRWRPRNRMGLKRQKRHRREPREGFMHRWASVAGRWEATVKFLKDQPWKTGVPLATFRPSRLFQDHILLISRSYPA